MMILTGNRNLYARSVIIIKVTKIYVGWNKRCRRSDRNKLKLYLLISVQDYDKLSQQHQDRWVATDVG